MNITVGSLDPRMLTQIIKQKKGSVRAQRSTAIQIHEYIKEKKLKRCTIERSSLSPVHRNCGICPGIVPFLDLGPRRILLLHERLSALRTVPRNLCYRINKRRGGASRDGTTTHVAIFLASVARLDGRFGAFYDGIRRSQTVPASAYEKCQTTGNCASCCVRIYRAIWFGWPRQQHLTGGSETTLTLRPSSGARYPIASFGRARYVQNSRSSANRCVCEMRDSSSIF